MIAIAQDVSSEGEIMKMSKLSDLRGSKRPNREIFLHNGSKEKLVEDNTVYFVGSGPGDPELITIKAKRICRKSRRYNLFRLATKSKNITTCKKRSGQFYDAAVLDREKFIDILRDSTK